MHVQDPVVFSGTVRDNLDPFGASAGDSAIWGALRQTGMSDTITHLVSTAFSLLQQVKQCYHICIALSGQHAPPHS